ncbi:MAG: dihydroorotase [Armatimonadetes bacterium]|nr:dihydroorotase [Armatimonadota bacterium]
MGLLLAGGRVIDPAAGMDAVRDVLVEGGRIAAVAPAIPREGHTVADVSDLVVAPGLVDLNVHLGDPGFTHREDVASGTRAAARGGITSLVCAADTSPAADHPVVVEGIAARAARDGRVRVHHIGALTKGLRGEELAPLGALAPVVCAFSDDPRPVPDASLLRKALTYARPFNRPVILRCEDASLAGRGFAHEGAMAAVLGLRGIPSLAEEVAVARDLLLAEATGVRVHLTHISTAGAVRLIREAKRRGVPVTCDVTPHHLMLTEEAVEGFRPGTRVQPPLRSAQDRDALREGLADGTIDAIASDHRPLAPEEVAVEYEAMPPGASGLETLLAAALTALVEPGIVGLPRVIACLTHVPASILDLPAGSLSPDAPADLVVIDPACEWVVDPDQFLSRGCNTPFAGMRVRGRAVAALVAGQVVACAPGFANTLSQVTGASSTTVEVRT